MFIGIDEDNSILIVHPDKTYQYLYPGFINPTSQQIVWGDGKFLYQNRVSSDVSIRGVYKIYTDRFGAPYHGRQ